MFKIPQGIWRTRVDSVLSQEEKKQLQQAIEAQDDEVLIKIYLTAFIELGLVDETNAERYIRRMVPEVKDVS